MDKFTKGDDFIGAGADHVTYGIHNETPGEEWSQQIEIYGDPDLRDRILRLLNEETAGERSQQTSKHPYRDRHMSMAGKCIQHSLRPLGRCDHLLNEEKDNDDD